MFLGQGLCQHLAPGLAHSRSSINACGKAELLPELRAGPGVGEGRGLLQGSGWSPPTPSWASQLSLAAWGGSVHLSSQPVRLAVDMCCPGRGSGSTPPRLWRGFISGVHSAGCLPLPLGGPWLGSPSGPPWWPFLLRLFPTSSGSASLRASPPKTPGLCLPTCELLCSSRLLIYADLMQNGSLNTLSN